MKTRSPQKQCTLEYVQTIGIVNNAVKGRGFSHPFDIALGSGGRIFVLNRGEPAYARVGVCNRDEDYLYEFGDHGDGEGAFRQPCGIVLDHNETVYITDESNHRVNMFKDTGEYLGRWGSHGSTQGQLDGPSGIAVDSLNHILIVDQNNHRIQKFTAEGEYISHWGSFGSGEGQFNMPWGIWIDAKDCVYVADWRNDRIQKFSPSGEFLISYGESGTSDGQLSRPSGVATDSEGYIYVTDWGNQRLVVFDPDGQNSVAERGKATLSKWAEEYLDANPEERDAREISNLWPELPEHLHAPLTVSSQTEAYFWGPSAVKLDGQGLAYVVEAPRHRFQIYRRS